MNIQSVSSPFKCQAPALASSQARYFPHSVVAVPFPERSTHAVVARNAHGDTFSLRFGSAEAASKGYRNDGTEQGFFSRAFSKLVHN
ncbi:MAG: hypothetical protein ACKO37_04635 [Vampirovibrionales bacterium]